MQRNLSLLAIGIALWSGAAVHAQGPPYAYPAYRPPTYPQPMLPMVGQPMRTPPMTVAPPYGAAPSQPYFVTDIPTAKAPPASQTLPSNLPPTAKTMPSPPRGEPVTVYEGPCSGEPPLDTEPMTHYEGNRYFAEMKLDNARGWVQAHYLHWWIQRPTVTPLVTSGATALLSGEIGPREFSGVQAQIGHWLDPDHRNAIEVTGQWLANVGRQYSFSSNAAGTPALGIPFLQPIGANVVAVATPGLRSGSIDIDGTMGFHGAEANLSQNVLRVNGWTFDYFGGGRYLYLDDKLVINQRRTALAPGALRFAGVAQPAGSIVRVSDSFNVTNTFYGGDIGARLHWTGCRLDLGVSGKVSLGNTRYVTYVNGSSTLTTPAGGTATLVGGTFAQASNIGRTAVNDFTVIPEGEASASYRLTDHIRIIGGYSFLYWNRVQRAADQLDRSVNPAQAPTSPVFNAAATGNPVLPNARSELWIHGVNVGLEIKY